YASGVLLYYEPANGVFATDAPGFYEDRAQSIAQGISSGIYPSGTLAELQTVNGVAALVTQNQDGWGDVDLVVDGYRIEIGAGYERLDAATLVEIANAIS